MNEQLDDLLYKSALDYKKQLYEALGRDPKKVLIELTQKHRIYTQMDATKHHLDEVQNCG